MMLFDFSSYLTSLLSLPPDQINIQLLTGGFTNFTVRATFTPPVHLSQFDQSKSFSSVVLKYAPPFMAADPTQAVSVHRQVIEAEALVLLSGSEMPAISTLLAKFPTLHIPTLIHHDKECNVLWMTDLGEAVTLSEYLTTDPPAHHSERIAMTLGEFLAKFFLSTRNPSAETLSLFTVPSSTTNTLSHLVSTMKNVLATAGVIDAGTLTGRVDQALRNSGTVEPCLGMVELWPGSILINAHEICGLVDWEFFGLSGAGSELGMLRESLSFSLSSPRLRSAKLRICI
jgi:hypothetical protein